MTTHHSVRWCARAFATLVFVGASACGDSAGDPADTSGPDAGGDTLTSDTVGATTDTSETTGTHPPDTTICTPACDGRACGDDGCGGTCGTCTGGDVCTDGACVPPCTPACDGKSCGDDGCGGTCGTCTGSDVCSDGQCTPCTPACDGKSCGDDGCGGTCGACTGSDVCTDGQCTPCVPACDGKSCGDDGCGGTCGTCTGSDFCSDGQCTPCVSDCDGKSCGDGGCGIWCGFCSPGEVCTVDGQCICSPSCGGKQCGDDGCGGTCGDCAPGLVCAADQCISPQDQPCDTDAGCGGGYYCDLGLGISDNPEYVFGWAGSCDQQTDGGVGFGEACDPNPADEVVLNDGDLCASTNLCEGGFCSALCETDVDCGDDGRCTIVEYIGDVDGNDVDDLLEPGFICEHAPQSATPCMAEADCADGETCNVFAAANPDDNATTDAPFLFNGVCVPSPAGAEAGYGNVVDFRAQCESGIGFELTDGTFACTVFCTMADQCDLDDGEGGTLEGICLPQLWSWGGDYDNPAVNIYAGMCLPAILLGSTGDSCATDFTCTEAGEACTPFTVGSDPTAAPSTDFVCINITDADGDLPTAALGDDCSSDLDCVSGLCTAESSGETGYCTALCSDTVDSCGAAMTCVDHLVYERQGAFAGNSGGYERCEKNVE